MPAKMKPWCQFLYLLFILGQVYVEGFYFCTFTEKIQQFPYEKTRTVQCVTSRCETDCCPATETKTWKWVACAVGPVVLLSVIVVVFAYCRKNKAASPFLAFLKKRAPFSESVTEIQLHNGIQAYLSTCTVYISPSPETLTTSLLTFPYQQLWPASHKQVPAAVAEIFILTTRMGQT